MKVVSIFITFIIVEHALWQVIILFCVFTWILYNYSSIICMPIERICINPYMYAKSKVRGKKVFDKVIKRELFKLWHHHVEEVRGDIHKMFNLRYLIWEHIMERSSRKHCIKKHQSECFTCCLGKSIFKREFDGILLTLKAIFWRHQLFTNAIKSIHKIIHGLW